MQWRRVPCVLCSACCGCFAFPVLCILCYASPNPSCISSTPLQSKGSSSLKADELLDLLKADISLNDVPQSGEPDEAVSCWKGRAVLAVVACVGADVCAPDHRARPSAVSCWSWSMPLCCSRYSWAWATPTRDNGLFH